MAIPTQEHDVEQRAEHDERLATSPLRDGVVADGADGGLDDDREERPADREEGGRRPERDVAPDVRVDEPERDVLADRGVDRGEPQPVERDAKELGHRQESGRTRAGFRCPRGEGRGYGHLVLRSLGGARRARAGSVRHSPRRCREDARSLRAGHRLVADGDGRRASERLWRSRRPRPTARDRRRSAARRPANAADRGNGSLGEARADRHEGTARHRAPTGSGGRSPSGPGCPPRYRLMSRSYSGK